MIPRTIGRQYDVGKIAAVQCIKNDMLCDLNIKNSCFLLLIVYEGSVYFEVGDASFEAVAPCFVCFDERENVRLVKKSDLKCDAIYFHPTFLNINMTFERVHSETYAEVAINHDMFLLRPFTDDTRYVFPLFEEYMDNLKGLFANLESELADQRDFYWSCRSRSYFMEMIFVLERAYGIIGGINLDSAVNKVKNPHLRNAVRYIECHYHENITLEHIIKAAALNHSTLTQLFRSELNITPIKYLWQYRIRVAKKHLEFTSLPVKDIAGRCGFKTVQHFSRRFEANTGETPTAFRDNAVARRKAAF